jgi:hypothetical protein
MVCSERQLNLLRKAHRIIDPGAEWLNLQLGQGVCVIHMERRHRRCVWPTDHNYLVKTNNEGVIIDSPSSERGVNAHFLNYNNACMWFMADGCVWPPGIGLCSVVTNHHKEHLGFDQMFKLMQIVCILEAGHNWHQFSKVRYWYIGTFQRLLKHNWWGENLKTENIYTFCTINYNVVSLLEVMRIIIKFSWSIVQRSQQESMNWFSVSLDN